MPIYVSAIRILAKGYLPNTLVTPPKLKEIPSEVKTTLQTSNPDYDLVIDRLNLYYDMQLVIFGIDKDKNLIIQFPVFMQPNMQQTLILYQLETVPVLIIDQSTHMQVEKQYLHLHTTARIKNLQKNWL